MKSYKLQMWLWVLHGIKRKFKNMLDLEGRIQNSGWDHTYKNIHLYIQGNGHMIFMSLSFDSTHCFSINWVGFWCLGDNAIIKEKLMFLDLNVYNEQRTRMKFTKGISWNKFVLYVHFPCAFPRFHIDTKSIKNCSCVLQTPIRFLFLPA